MNVHEYPSDPSLVPAYQIAVQQEALKGRPVETRAQSIGSWCFTAAPCWNWGIYDYRIAPSKVAAGHNPDNLTEEQVGVADGWRLLERDEIAKRSMTFDIECWWKPSARWDPTGWCGEIPSLTYRTKKPAGYFLPKKFYRSRTGLFGGPQKYYTEVAGEKVTFVNLDGSRGESSFPAGYYFPLIGWVEFDGNPAPFIEKTQQQKDDEAYHRAFSGRGPSVTDTVRKMGWDAALRYARETQ